MPWYLPLKSDSQNVREPSEVLLGVMFSFSLPTAQTAPHLYQTAGKQMGKTPRLLETRGHLLFWVYLTFHSFNHKVIKPETKGNLSSRKRPLSFLTIISLTIFPYFKTQIPEFFPNQPARNEWAFSHTPPISSSLRLPFQQSSLNTVII